MNDEEKVYYTRPLEMDDVLAAVRFALSFDSDGWAVSGKRLTKRCRRFMASIADSAGFRPKGDGVVRLAPAGRAMEVRWLRMAEIVNRHCAACPHMIYGRCAGPDLK